MKKHSERASGAAGTEAAAGRNTKIEKEECYNPITFMAAGMQNGIAALQSPEAILN